MFKEISSVEDLISESQENPIIIYNHSSTCPISADAHTQVENFSINSNQDVYLLTVQSQRELSKELADKIEVKHETPQVIILSKGKPIYVANHYDISEKEITKKIK